MPITLVVIIRSVIAFFTLLFFVRIMGKQQVAQLTFFDYVVGITIGSLAGTLSVQLNENTLSTLTGMVTWTLLAIFLAIAGIHSKWIQKIVDGEPTVVVENGKLLEDKLKKIRIPIDELLSELRSLGVFNITDVEFAVFEPGGKLSVQKKSQKQPVTPSDINISTRYNGLPTTLIVDGTILFEELKTLNLSNAWLHHQLSKNNLHDTTDISLAQLDTQGNLYVDLKGDKPFHIISTKD